MKLEYIVANKTNGANPFKIFEALKKIDADSIAFSIQRMPYDSFLKSAYWFAVSMVAKSRAGMRCQICNSTDRIETHHRTYDTHGKEHQNMMDLVVLCNNCHGLFHGHKQIEPPRMRKVNGCGGKVKGLRVIPHTEFDLKVPDEPIITLTHSLINACRANGSFTNATLKAFGLCKPLVAGWPDRLVGKQMTREEYRQAQEGRFIYRAKLP